MTLVFKGGNTRKNRKYVCWYEDGKIEENSAVATFEDPNSTNGCNNNASTGCFDIITFRIADSGTNKSILVVGTIGRDNTVNLAVQKDGNNESDTGWLIDCPTTTNINNGSAVLKIDNLSNTTVTVAEIG